MNENFSTAIEYVRRGLSIIPLQPLSKEPNARFLPIRTDHAGNVVYSSVNGKPLRTWQPYVEHHANESEVYDWFAQCPNLNLAVLTGATSGVIVLDIDGPEGETFVRKQGKLPYTPTTRTGRGRHVWFKHPGFMVRNFTKKVHQLDMRADGGYVCVYPSVHPNGSQYKWEIGLDVPFALAPSWLLDLVKGQKRTTAAPSLVSSAANAIHETTRYGTAALVAETKEVAATMVNRNIRLYRAALKMGSLIAAGEISRFEVEQALFMSAEKCGLATDDGLSQVLRTIASGINKGMESPRGSHNKR